MGPEKHPLQAAAAQLLTERARTAIEHAIPKGCRYTLLIQGPGFNTIASNLDQTEQLTMIREAQIAVQQDVLGFGR